MTTPATLEHPESAGALRRRRLRSAVEAAVVGSLAGLVIVSAWYVMHQDSAQHSLAVLLPQLLLAAVLPLLVYRSRMHSLAAAAADAAHQLRLRHVIESTGVGVWEMDLDAGLMHVSESWLRMAGRPPMAARTLRISEWRALIHPDDCAAVFAAANAGVQGAEALFGMDHRIRHELGHWIWVAARGRVLECRADGSPRVLVGTHADISARKAAEEALAAAAYQDRLTGLANRSFFMEQLRARVEAARHDSRQHFAVLFLDFDRFKIINDAMGHQAGDDLLVQVAQRLRTNLGEIGRINAMNPLIARFGGDEFVVLLDGLHDAADAGLIADQLLDALSYPYVIRGREVHSTASIGIVTGGQDAPDAGTLVRNADLAMYEAKRAGRARSMLFCEKMHARLSRSLQIETSLRRAIGTAQFSLVYQPIVELDTGRRTSVEALLRWEHPVMGQVSPGEFVPVAEECGLIGALGEWVMHEACAQLARWRAQDAANAPHVVSVNVSRAELAQGERLLHTVRSALSKARLPAGCLLLEVTEREVMRDPAASLALMHQLHEIGVHLAMDDFGTGTSSLGCLRDYPFDVIKIDRSFTAGIAAGPDTLAVIHATITLVENLGKTSVAEGVETPEQLAILQSLGCHYAQGYYLGRPLTAEEVLQAANLDAEPRAAIA
ncbi:MAG: EAL domain-containing protein [Steroidobacteraceae bacterium]